MAAYTVSMLPLRTISLLALPWTVFGAPVSPPQVPENMRVPPGQEVVLKALGKGVQIYACKESATDGRFEWILSKPEANLIDENGARVGRHFAGPTWEAADGSRVTGQVQQRANAPRPNAVPWLLLKATSNQGTGTFAHVTYIQRVDTNGGQAPSDPCDRSQSGVEKQVSYQAGYYFYTPR